MAFHRDYDYVVEGNLVAFRTAKSKTIASLPAGQSFSLDFQPVQGAVEVSIDGLNAREPTRVRQIGSSADPREPAEGPGSVRDEFNHVPMRIELIAAGERRPVVTWQTQEGWTSAELFAFQHVVGDADSPGQAWTLRVTNQGRVTATVTAGVGYVFDREPVRSHGLPLFLIDHVYTLILAALTPSARIAGQYAFVNFGEELKEYFRHTGEEVPAALGEQKIPLPHGLEGTGHTLGFEIEAGRGTQLLEAMRERWERRKDELERALNGARTVQDQFRIRTQIDENEEWKRSWETRVRDDFAILHASLACTDVTLTKEILDYGYGTWDFDAVIEDVFVHLYLAFDPGLTQCHALVLSTATITGGEADTLEYLGFLPDANELIEAALPGPIERASAYIGRFLGEALARLCAQGSVFMQLRADAFSWQVKYTAVPAEGSPQPGGGTRGRPGDDVRVGAGSGGDAVVRDPSRGGPGVGPQPGPMPDDFVVRARPDETVDRTLARLDEIETIVVVMMENRSFDHMLGYLRNAGRDVEGLRGNESNAVEGRTVRIKLARDIVQPIATRILHSPRHGYDAVMAQIAEGAMSGFAADYEARYPGYAEHVMSYYTGEELKTYHMLASEYMVCDRWFAAHPGGTWPNRWITLGGTTPDLRNLAFDDVRMGFMPGPTVFDTLDAFGIPWHYFESDLSIMRTYDRYRLNTSRVVPLRNAHGTPKDFFTLAQEGGLPPVVFIDPNFSDIPPLSTANDDLAPVDLRRGQDFVGQIYNALAASSQWRRTLFVITYDEHGGFYDHVPPPGTRLGPPEWLDAAGAGTVPPVLSDDPNNTAPRHYGVRVPAFVVSPWVEAGSVCKEILDHTAILKTILVRHRDKLSTAAFRQFGPRVMQSAHLGLALNRDTARTGQPAPVPRLFPRFQPETRRPGSSGEPRRRAVQQDDFHESLPRAFLPKRT